MMGNSRKTVLYFGFYAPFSQLPEGQIAIAGARKIDCRLSVIDKFPQV